TDEDHGRGLVRQGAHYGYQRVEIRDVDSWLFDWRGWDLEGGRHDGCGLPGPGRVRGNDCVWRADQIADMGGDGGGVPMAAFGQGAGRVPGGGIGLRFGMPQDEEGLHQLLLRLLVTQGGRLAGARGPGGSVVFKVPRALPGSASGSTWDVRRAAITVW